MIAKSTNFCSVASNLLIFFFLDKKPSLHSEAEEKSRMSKDTEV